MFKSFFEKRKIKAEEKEKLRIEYIKKIMNTIDSEESIIFDRNSFQSPLNYIPTTLLPRGENQEFCSVCGTKFKRLITFDYNTETGEKNFHKTNWLLCDGGHKFSVPHSEPDSPYELGTFSLCEHCGEIKHGYYWE